jgi:hypothetical protein
MKLIRHMFYKRIKNIWDTLFRKTFQINKILLCEKAK